VIPPADAVTLQDRLIRVFLTVDKETVEVSVGKRQREPALEESAPVIRCRRGPQAAVAV
jgi:hypothetical protein